jgi:hypothetical protein
MSQDASGPLVFVRKSVDGNAKCIEQVAELYLQRAENDEMRAILRRQRGRIDQEYQREHSRLRTVADRINTRLASLARHPSNVDQRELLDALLLVMREFDGHDEDVLNVMREHILSLMAIVVTDAPVLTFTEAAGWRGGKVESDMHLQWSGTSADKAWRLFIRFTAGEGELYRFTIPLDVCDGDLAERLADHDLYVGVTAIEQFLARQAVQQTLDKPETLRAAILKAELDGGLCNNIVGT